MFFNQKSGSYTSVALNRLSKRLFKNKALLKQSDIQITKLPNYLKINVLGGGDLSLNKKSFLFDNHTNSESIVLQMEHEYNLSFTLENELKEKLDQILQGENIFAPDEKKLLSNIEEIKDIAKKLNIEETKLVDFVGQFLENTEVNIRDEKHLKILHFNIITEIERLDKIKNRIDQIASRRVTFYLLILALILIVQTALFYHMIFNVEHLGWDLVEPATFLFGSIVFLLGVFSYVKLHKNVISGESMFHDFKKVILMRRYIRDNFNIEKYNYLNNQLGMIQRQLQYSNKL